MRNTRKCSGILRNTTAYAKIREIPKHIKNYEDIPEMIRENECIPGNIREPGEMRRPARRYEVKSRNLEKCWGRSGSTEKTREYEDKRGNI